MEAQVGGHLSTTVLFNSRENACGTDDGDCFNSMETVIIELLTILKSTQRRLDMPNTITKIQQLKHTYYFFDTCICSHGTDNV